jgi:hypothetical protein
LGPKTKTLEAKTNTLEPKVNISDTLPSMINQHRP